MLAVLRNGVPLTSATSTSTADPERTASAASSGVSTPTSRAKWLSVPAGMTASGRACSSATAAAAAPLPAPPAPPRARAAPERPRGGARHAPVAAGHPQRPRPAGARRLAEQLGHPGVLAELEQLGAG